MIDRWQTDFRLKHCTVTTSSVNRNKTGRAMPKGKNEKPSCARNLTDGIKLKCNKSEIDPMRLNQFGNWTNSCLTTRKTSPSEKISVTAAQPWGVGNPKLTLYC